MIASSFNPQAYGPEVQTLLEPRRLPELGPGQPNHAVLSRLDTLSDEALFAGRPLTDASMAAACRAALWLYHDFLDRSHKISQDIETREGSFWHAMMHRREGDYSNSKYWLRRVGRHPVFATLATAAHKLEAEAVAPGTPVLFPADADWDPFRFVDLCQRASGQKSAEESLFRRVQQCEWDLLFDHCYRQAIAGKQ